MTTPVIRVKDVSFSYGKREVLSGATFQVNPGEFVGLIGPNGGGKTTMIRLILNLLPLDKGAIQLFGKDLHRFTEWSRISYIPQKATSFDAQFPATVFEIASIGRVAKRGLGKALTAEDREIVMKSLKLMDMDGFAKQRIGDLSGGQQQRVFIAKALAGEPDLLIMDEPTVGVDIGTEERFYKLLKSVNQKTKLTMIIISHDIHLISKYVNKMECLNKTLRSCPVDTFKSHAKIHKLEESLFGHEHFTR